MYKRLLNAVPRNLNLSRSITFFPVQPFRCQIGSESNVINRLVERRIKFENIYQSNQAACDDLLDFLSGKVKKLSENAHKFNDEFNVIHSHGSVDIDAIHELQSARDRIVVQGRESLIKNAARF